MSQSSAPRFPDTLDKFPPHYPRAADRELARHRHRRRPLRQRSSSTTMAPRRTSATRPRRFSGRPVDRALPVARGSAPRHGGDAQRRLGRPRQGEELRDRLHRPLGPAAARSPSPARSCTTTPAWRSARSASPRTSARSGARDRLATLGEVAVARVPRDQQPARGDPQPDRAARTRFVRDTASDERAVVEEERIEAVRREVGEDSGRSSTAWSRWRAAARTARASTTAARR